MEPTTPPVLSSEPLTLAPAPDREAEFASLFPPDATLDLLATGGTWFEGPAWTGEDEIVWSDVVGNRLLVWTSEAGAGILLEPSHHQNGHAIDNQGRLVAASHGERAIVRREHDGAWHVLTDRHEDRRFNSPNDLVVDKQGAIWFTDPRYGIDKPEEGYGGTVEMDGCRVYRLAPDGTVTAVTSPHPGPNGLAFSPDESVLYLADSEVGRILAFEVLDGGARLGEPVTFAVLDPGPPDGIRVDTEGRVWSSCASGIQVFVATGAGAAGVRLGSIPLPHRTANLAFGGPDRSTLAVTATGNTYRIRTNAHSAA